MKFFLDTANLDEIREAESLGMLDGVTTNPTLVSKEGGVDFKQHIAAICEITQGPVSAEVTSLDTEGMLREGREYARIAPNVVVKCPLTTDGLKATRILSGRRHARQRHALLFSRAGNSRGQGRGRLHQSLSRTPRRHRPERPRPPRRDCGDL